ncbi:MAG: PLP-dependent aminotransferase family protein [Chloroflexi bacterium]|nr:PLP-dependent aminotransferase family protein [Chloroflexota bacterium]
MTTQWQGRYAERTERMTSSAIRELLKITQQPDIISFAGGLPAPESFPLMEITRAACNVMDDAGDRALQYSPTEGFVPLRKFIVEKMSRYGIVADLDNVVITTGSQQALDLIGKILIDPNDVILCEAPSYLGALQAFAAYQARYVTVLADDDGMQVECIEPILKKRKIKFIYALPNFQNPSGVTMSLKRREKLVALADKYSVPILEDDPYGELRFEGEHLPPLVVLDEQRQMKRHRNGLTFDRGNVIYAGTFSKTLAPGLRLGWVVAPRQVVHKIVQAKQGADLHSSTLDQMIAAEVLRPTEFHLEHVRKIRAMYRERRDAMIAAMEKYFPVGSRWTRPQGGLFLWVTLPEGIDTTALLPEAVANKVAFVPGVSFFPASVDAPKRIGRGKPLPRGHNTMRLNFSNSSPTKIEIGIQRLGAAITKAVESQSIASHRSGRSSATRS